jgi:preprotein translocase subunit SecD
VTTLIDLAVVVLFTHPVVAILAHTAFFGGGHNWSGLDPERLGAKPRYVGRGKFSTPRTPHPAASGSGTSGGSGGATEARTPTPARMTEKKA